MIDDIMKSSSYQHPFIDNIPIKIMNSQGEMKILSK